jgi:hypothetical protein
MANFRKFRGNCRDLIDVLSHHLLGETRRQLSTILSTAGVPFEIRTRVYSSTVTRIGWLSSVKTNRLILFKATVTVYFENHTKHTNTLPNNI